MRYLPTHGSFTHSPVHRVPFLHLSLSLSLSYSLFFFCFSFRSPSPSLLDSGPSEAADISEALLATFYVVFLRVYQRRPNGILDLLLWVPWQATATYAVTHLFA
jgi:hypothetical protein